jgi:hypothetical protein
MLWIARPVRRATRNSQYNAWLLLHVPKPSGARVKDLVKYWVSQEHQQIHLRCLTMRVPNMISIDIPITYSIHTRLTKLGIIFYCTKRKLGPEPLWLGPSQESLVLLRFPAFPMFPRFPRFPSQRVLKYIFLLYYINKLMCLESCLTASSVTLSLNTETNY